MAKIKLLAADEIKKIAAGEVVERPATIVKELVENAIDAGAQTIKIHVRQGGCNFIRVTDTGCGMSLEDAHLACAVHATSKITTVDDLQVLNTYGFRGEALASIAAVSTLTLTTRDESRDVGIQLLFEHGMLIKEQETSCQQGTDITVEKLFDNVPARKKFLKTADTELRVIVTLFQSFVLAHKTIHFQLFHDDALVYNCPSVETVLARCAQLWDHYVAQQLVPITFNDMTMGVSGSGVISVPSYLRYNTAQVFLLVNNRWIKNINLTRAILKGYSGALPQGRYPVAVLFLTVDSALVDVNIHPRKEEVKFVYEHKIEQLVQQAVKNGLEHLVTQQVQTGQVQSSSVASYQAAPAQQSKYTSQRQTIEPIFTPGRALKEQEFFDKPLEVLVQAPVFEKPHEEQLVYAPERSYRLIGQCYKTYLMLEKEGELIFVDQHAAHERILYELMIKNRAQAQPIALLFPQLVTVSRQALDLLNAYIDVLAQYGIIGEGMGDDRFVIRQVPAYLKHINLVELITELVTFLQDSDVRDTSFLTKLSERLCIQMACKAAVKAGDELLPEKMYEILDQLETIENRATCPHGRPTVWSLKKPELEKKFKRDYTTATRFGPV